LRRLGRKHGEQNAKKKDGRPDHGSLQDFRGLRDRPKLDFYLTYAGSPKEAVEFFKRGMRLDPHNPSRYLTGLGRAHFCMEELEEAVGLYEKTMRLNPETATWAWGWCLAAFYALLGRDQEGRASSGPNTRRVFPRFQRKPADRRRDQEPAHRFDDHRVRFLSPAILDNVSEGWRIHLSGAWFHFF